MLFKYCLIVHPSSGMEDNGADRDLNCQWVSQEVSEKNNFSMLPKNHSCDILVTNMAGVYFALVRKICLRIK